MITTNWPVVDKPGPNSTSITCHRELVSVVVVVAATNLVTIYKQPRQVAAAEVALPLMAIWILVQIQI